MHTESDAEIVRQTLAGARHAFETLIRRYNRMAYAVAFARLGNHQDTEDAVQESWIQAFITLDRLREPDHFPAWLASIVRNISLNATRNKWRRQSLDDAGGDLMVDYRKPIEDADLHRALWTQVEAMSPEHREVLTLHYHAGMSTEEIATWSGVPREAVKKRLQRARATLSDQTLKTLFEPAEREEESRRKRVMAALLMLPLDWRRAPLSATPAKPVPPAPRTLQLFGKDWPLRDWIVVALLLLIGAVLLSIYVFWLFTPSTPAPTPQPGPGAKPSAVQIETTGTTTGGKAGPPPQQEFTGGKGGAPTKPQPKGKGKG